MASMHNVIVLYFFICDSVYKAYFKERSVSVLDIEGSWFESYCEQNTLFPLLISRRMPRYYWKLLTGT